MRSLKEMQEMNRIQRQGPYARDPETLADLNRKVRVTPKRVEHSETEDLPTIGPFTVGVEGGLDYSEAIGELHGIVWDRLDDIRVLDGSGRNCRVHIHIKFSEGD